VGLVGGVKRRRVMKCWSDGMGRWCKEEEGEEAFKLVGWNW